MERNPDRALRASAAASTSAASTSAARATAGPAAAAGTAAAAAAAPVLVDGGEHGTVDVLDRGGVLLDVRVLVQMLDRLRVARDRIELVDPVVVEPVVDDVEPAVVRRARESRRRRGGGRDAAREQRDRHRSGDQ